MYPWTCFGELLLTKCQNAKKCLYGCAGFVLNEKITFNPYYFYKYAY